MNKRQRKKARKKRFDRILNNMTIIQVGGSSKEPLSMYEQHRLVDITTDLGLSFDIVSSTYMDHDRSFDLTYGALMLALICEYGNMSSSFTISDGIRGKRSNNVMIDDWKGL